MSSDSTHSSKLLKVIHIAHPEYLPPSHTFVGARVLNPVCQRPVPVITHHVTPQYANTKEIQFFALDTLNRFRRRIELGIGNHWHWYPYYYQVIRRVRPQIIHAHFSGAGEACLWISQRLGIPLVINFYGIETKYHLHDPFWIPRYKKMFVEAEWFVCSSREMQSIMLDKGCPATKISVIPVSVDIDLFNGEPTPWNKNQTLRLLSIARLHPEKGLNYLLSACRLLDEMGLTNWALRIIGIGTQESELKRQARECGIQSKVFFLGRKSPDEIVAELRRSHLMILPSLAESQGLALQEAQATCTPVIATNIGGIPEGVKHNETGFLVDPQSPQAIFQALERFVEQPELFDVMGRAGRALVQEHFSRQKEYQELAQLYRNLIYGSN
jgi:colanic acid/amylovoran biosynthesis glycosyltransferase